MGYKEFTVIFSADRTWFAVEQLGKPIWLSVEAAIMPGRSYWRRFTAVGLTPGPSETRIAGDEMVADYRDASWWTPGIDEPVAEAAVEDSTPEKPRATAQAKSKKAVK